MLNKNLINDKSILVKYRYVINMPDVIKPYPDVINKWTSDEYLNKLYDGQLMLSISPVFNILNSKFKLYQIQLDMETDDIKSLFYYCLSIIKKYDDFYMCYTGKRGFHIYSNFLILMENNKSISEINKMLISPLNINTKFLDYTSSIRDVSTIRIGKRLDTGRLAFPILVENFDWFKNNINIKKFSNIKGFTKNNLKQFITKFLLPINKIFYYDQFLNNLK